MLQWKQLCLHSTEPGESGSLRQVRLAPPGMAPAASRLSVTTVLQDRGQAPLEPHAQRGQQGAGRFLGGDLSYFGVRTGRQLHSQHVSGRTPAVMLTASGSYIRGQNGQCCLQSISSHKLVACLLLMML